MIRAAVAVVALGLLGLFGYYFVTDTAEQNTGEKAKDAAVRVADTVRDTGVVGLINARIKSRFGIEDTRFVHAYFDNGRAVIYGLLPAEVSSDDLLEEVRGTPGVNAVDQFLTPLPDFLAGSGPNLPEVPPAPAPPEAPDGP